MACSQTDLQSKFKFAHGVLIGSQHSSVMFRRVYEILLTGGPRAPVGPAGPTAPDSP